MAQPAKKNENTSHDLHEVEASEELLLAAKEFDLGKHLVKLLINEPFFSTLMRNVTKIKSEHVSTAGVTIRDGEFILLWNAMFLASLKSKEVRGLLKHESYHLIFNHCSSRKQDPHKIWNIATDLAINSLISHDELPEGGLYPGKPLDLSKVTDPVTLEKWKKVSDLIESFPTGEASEWYMTKLKENQEVADTISEGGGGKCNGNCQPGGNGQSCDGECNCGIPGGMDDHEGWGDLTDEEQQVAEAQIKQALSEAVKKCDRNGQWGTVSGSTREQLRLMVSNAIDWKRVIQNFCGNSQRANKARTHKRVNRKYPYIHPGVKRGHSATIAVYMDQSGSVGNDDVELFFGCLNQLGRITKFLLYPFDWSVDEDNACEWRKGQKSPPIRHRAGGTSFDAVEAHVRGNLGKWDAHVILTDGEASDPGPSLQRRCWVLLPGCSLPFSPYGNDIVVEMNDL